ncbi:MAG: 30S ribosomal protein S4 [Brevinematia bacterium]
MGRYTGPLCKLCRREGVRLFLKGDKCFSQGCILNKKAYPPGKVSKFLKKPTEYALQLREKQKLKRYYGLYERQFRKFFALATKHKGVTGEMLLQYLERRLDNVIYRAGFAQSRRTARQLVSHGHVYVNGKRVTIPSYIVKVNDEIELSSSAKVFDNVVKSIEASVNRVIPSWLEVDNSKVSVKVTAIPTRQEMNIDIEVNEQLVVELYSK